MFRFWFIFRAENQRLRDLPVRSSARFEEKWVGEYDMNIDAQSLGISETGGVDGRRAILVSTKGPGIGEESVFEAEHADEVDRESLIGLTPSMPSLSALAPRPRRHGLPDRPLMDVIGGVVNVEPRQDQVQIVASLPGVIATTTGPRLAAYGSAEFLRAGAEQPGSRLLKSGAQPPGSGEYHPPAWQFSGRAAGCRASGVELLDPVAAQPSSNGSSLHLNQARSSLMCRRNSATAPEGATSDKVSAIRS